MAINGIVKFFNRARGFGYIAPEDGSKDVIVHATALEASSVSALDAGDKVTFEIETYYEGFGGSGEQATNITLLS